MCMYIFSSMSRNLSCLVQPRSTKSTEARSSRAFGTQSASSRSGSPRGMWAHDVLGGPVQLSPDHNCTSNLTITWPTLLKGLRSGLWLQIWPAFQLPWAADVGWLLAPGGSILKTLSCDTVRSRNPAWLCW